MTATETPKTRQEQVWGYLNSSFGIWLLSSVVLTGLTSWHASSQDYRAREGKRHDAIKQLDLEIRESLLTLTTGLSDATFTLAPAQRALDHRAELVGVVRQIWHLASEDHEHAAELGRYADTLLQQEAAFQHAFYQIHNASPAPSPEKAKTVVIETAKATLDRMKADGILKRWGLSAFEEHLESTLAQPIVSTSETMKRP